MGQTVQLQAADGHALDAYRSDPDGAAKAGLVVVQEAFGVNEHIRAVCDDFAALGYAALAPAIYDRQQRHATFGYDEASAAQALKLRSHIKYDEVMLDIAAAARAARRFGRVGIVGYCVGGSAAWLAACRLDVEAAACYYPSDIGKQTQEQPRCAATMHFGQRDRLISSADVEKLRSAHPFLPIYVYPTGHGFNNRHRPGSYDDSSARLALERTLTLFEKHLTR